MQLRLTLVDPARARSVDVEVDAPTGALLADLGPQLRAMLAGDEEPDAPTCEPAWFIGEHEAAADAVLGLPPLLDGALLSLGRPATAVEPVGLLTLAAVAGPAAGTVLPLLPGQRTLGRSTSCSLPLPDPDCSRLHAVLDVSPAGVLVRDLASTNGTEVDGRAADPEGTAVGHGQLLRIGSSLLEVMLPGDGAGPASSSTDSKGHLLVNRPPRVRPEHAPCTVTFPPPPAARPATRFPLLATAVPLLLGLVLALAVDPRFALFVLLSPVMLIGNWASERWGGRRARREDARRHRAETAQAEERLRTALSDELSDLRQRHPDLARLLLTAELPTARVWERRRAEADFLAVRLGTGTIPASTRRVDPPSSDKPSEAPLELVDAPVVVGLEQVGHLGITGPELVARRLAASIVGQVAVLHSPLDVELAVLVPGADGRVGGGGPEAWAWSRWLPHSSDPTGTSPDPDLLLARLLARLEEHPPAGGRRWTGPRLVLVLDGARALRQDPRVARVLAEGPAVGVHCVCLERSPRDLPAECGAVVDLDETGELLLSTAGTLPARSRADLPPAGWAVRVARALAPLRDATPADDVASLPASVRLLDLVADDPTDPEQLQRRWDAAVPGLEAVIGVGLQGPLHLDLAADGPHALIAGTTGAGKSELLRTLVASLAASHPPEALQLLLVDYKGGSAFDECVRLPHVSGLVTDLDGHLTARVLASLSAELRRRERLLRAAGAADIASFRSLASLDGGPVLPRLVVVVDELAALVEELPDFVSGLVGVAQRGRSLGVHLVLATQRPAGVVGPDVRANTAVRIALRVTDPAESVDVVDVPDAALLARSVPGRALLRTATGSAVPWQAACVSTAAPRRERGGPVVRRLGTPTSAPVDRRQQDPLAGGGGQDPAERPSDLSRLVQAARAAAACRRAPLPAPPWLPPLPEVVLLEELPPSTASSAGPVDDLVPFAVSDMPSEQRRDVVALQLGGPHLAITGGPRSGRTSTLRTLALAAAGAYGPDRVHLHVAEGAGRGLGSLGALPHTGTLVGRDDPARLDRLVRRLLEEVARRQALRAAAEVSCLAGQDLGEPAPAESSSSAAAPSDADPPWVLLLVDGWEGVADALDGVDHGRGLDDLLRLLREGPAVGVTAVVAGERQVVMGRVGALLPQRLVLRPTDVADAALAGLAPRELPERMPPGRGMLLAGGEGDLQGGVEVQVALPAADRSQQAQVGAVAATAARWAPASIHPPLRLVPLPPSVARAGLPAPCAEGLAVPLGLAGDEAAPVTVQLAADPVLLVAGPPGSGRTSTLATIGLGAAQASARLLALASARSSLAAALRDCPDAQLLPADDADGLTRRLDPAALADAPGPHVLLVDDVERFDSSPLEPALLALLDRASSDAAPLAVVAAGNADALATAFRGLAPALRRHRAGLLLRPSGGLEADLLGTRVPRLDAAPPGRGVLVLGGRTSVVQVALP
ncbi:MAG TPA: FtsK/SpoIIIE domain-containing protein [Motilibacteraceae bacterium]|nr:FtsK/SpoIIIE domain-containing protein [Motilibacteraceae bacterium]